MTESQTAFLVLRAPALLPDNQAERHRLLASIAKQLDIEPAEVELTTITNIAAEGADQAARFPVPQASLADAAREVGWGQHMEMMFLMPDPI